MLRIGIVGLLLFVDSSVTIAEEQEVCDGHDCDPGQSVFVQTVSAKQRNRQESSGRPLPTVARSGELLQTNGEFWPFTSGSSEIACTPGTAGCVSKGSNDQTNDDKHDGNLNEQSTVIANIDSIESSCDSYFNRKDQKTFWLPKTGCSWTAIHNCPGQPQGSGASAIDDGTLGYECCCTQGLWNQESPGISSAPTSDASALAKAQTQAPKQCRWIGATAGTDAWCNSNCNNDPPSCPAADCDCLVAPEPVQEEPEAIQGGYICCAAKGPGCHVPCKKRQSIEEYCAENPDTQGCPDDKPVKEKEDIQGGPQCQIHCATSKHSWADKCRKLACSGCASCQAPAPAQQKCKPFCAKREGDWATKCSNENCSGCSACVSQVPPAGECLKWCATSLHSWATKCRKDSCAGCSSCDKALEAGECKEWCAVSKMAWVAKCTNDKCAGCSQCEVARGYT